MFPQAMHVVPSLPDQLSMYRCSKFVQTYMSSRSDELQTIPVQRTAGPFPPIPKKNVCERQPKLVAPPTRAQMGFLFETLRVAP